MMSDESVPLSLEESRDSASRPSAMDPQKQLERRIPPLFALFFYGFPILAAWALLYNSYPGRSAELWSLRGLPEALTWGIGFSLVLLLVRWAGLRFLPLARALESEFGWILGRQRKWEVLVIALISAVGEEYFFRGWLQTTTGLWISAAIFGVLHWPINRNFILWPIFAFSAGLGFGWLTHSTGTLWAAVAAHAVYNGVALWRIGDRFSDWNQNRVDAFIQRA